MSRPGKRLRGEKRDADRITVGNRLASYLARAIAMKHLKMVACSLLLSLPRRGEGAGRLWLFHAKKALDHS
jgi:hypothetical protein